MAMSYKTLLVCLDEHPRSSDRQAFALRLAAIHGAHLTALYLDQVPFDALKTWDTLASAVKGYEDDAHRRRQRARERFESAARDAGINHAWFAAREYDMEAAVAFARDYDLVITRQFDPDRAGSRLTDTFPDRLLLGTGRPTLLFPPTGNFSADFNHVAIAWNGSRESARAVADALPLLRRARHITIIAAPARNFSVHLPEPDLATYLWRHDVAAGFTLQACGVDERDAVLARLKALELPVDLVVAGAYGHSRYGEIVFGGVTRALLGEAFVPLFMSH
jgi:hypothetical protein